MRSSLVVLGLMVALVASTLAQDLASTVTSFQAGVATETEFSNGGVSPGDLVRMEMPSNTGGFVAESASLWTVDELSTMAGIANIHFADLNGDGNADAVGLLYSGSHIVWYESDGSGGFGAQNTIATVGGLYGSAVTVADVDGDGDLDVLVGIFGSDTIHLATNNDFAASWTHTTVGTIDKVRMIRTVDLNNDGLLDVVAVSDSGQGGVGNRFAAFVNNGDGSFTKRTADASASSSHAVGAGDLNGDGLADAVSLGFTTVDILLNDGDGTSFTRSVYTPPFQGGSGKGVFIDDFNGDGHADILCVNTFRVFYLVGDGSGAFTSQVEVFGRYAIANIYDADYFDMNADGAPDLVLAVGSRIAWAEGSGFFKVHWVEATYVDAQNDGPFRFIGAGDMDGDGDVDLITSSVNTSFRSQLYTNIGGVDPSPQGSANYFIGDGEDLTDYVFADMDGDGDLDAVVSGTLVAPVGWYENVGSGQFFNTPTVMAADEAVAVAAGEFTGDAHIDVVASYNANLHLLTNGGAGAFSGTGTQVSALECTHLAAGDVNGDTDTDVVCATATDAYWLESDGAGAFTQHHIAAMASITDVQVVDFDGDTHLDVVIVKLGDVRVYWGDGAGALSQHGITTSNVELLRMVDIDGDGDLDVATQVGAQIFKTLQTSPRVLAAPAVAVNTGFIPTAWAAGDVDGDSMADYAYYTLDRMYIQLSTGSTIQGADTLDNVMANFVDVDGDGDLDLVSVANSNQLAHGFFWVENALLPGYVERVDVTVGATTTEVTLPRVGVYETSVSTNAGASWTPQVLTLAALAGECSVRAFANGAVCEACPSDDFDSTGGFPVACDVPAVASISGLTGVMVGVASTHDVTGGVSFVATEQIAFTTDTDCTGSMAGLPTLTLTSDTGLSVSPVWSSAGTHIACLSVDNGATFSPILNVDSFMVCAPGVCVDTCPSQCDGACDTIDLAGSSDCEGACNVGDASDGPDCDGACGTSDVDGSPDCDAVCDPADEAGSVDCEGSCDATDDAASPDCDTVCGAADNADGPDCDEVCDENDSAAGPDCDTVCDQADSALGPDCDGVCDDADSADGPDCDEVCDAADSRTSPDCPQCDGNDVCDVGETGEGACAADCDGACRAGDHVDSPDCDEVCDAGDDVPGVTVTKRAPIALAGISSTYDDGANNGAVHVHVGSQSLYNDFGNAARALMRFADTALNGVTVASASIVASVNKEAPMYVTSQTYDAYLLSDIWSGVGTVASNWGSLSTAAPGSVTWMDADFGVQAWTTPGGDLLDHIGSGVRVKGDSHLVIDFSTAGLAVLDAQRGSQFSVLIKQRDEVMVSQAIRLDGPSFELHLTGDTVDAAAGPDCSSTCDVADPAGSPDCDGTCDAGDEAGSADCNGSCEWGEDGSPDCTGSCNIGDQEGPITVPSASHPRFVSMGNLFSDSYEEEASNGFAEGNEEWFFMGARNNGGNGVARAVWAFRGAVDDDATEVTLFFHHESHPSSFTNTLVQLFATTSPFSLEGAVGSDYGAGVTPQEHSITWLHSDYPTTLWNTPGGDYDDTLLLGSVLVTPTTGMYEITIQGEALAAIKAMGDDIEVFMRVDDETPDSNAFYGRTKLTQMTASVEHAFSSPDCNGNKDAGDEFGSQDWNCNVNADCAAGEYCDGERCEPNTNAAGCDALGGADLCDSDFFCNTDNGECEVNPGTCATGSECDSFPDLYCNGDSCMLDNGQDGCDAADDCIASLVCRGTPRRCEDVTTEACSVWANNDGDSDCATTYPWDAVYCDGVVCQQDTNAAGCEDGEDDCAQNFHCTGTKVCNHAVTSISPTRLLADHEHHIEVDGAVVAATTLTAFVYDGADCTVPGSRFSTSAYDSADAMLDSALTNLGTYDLCYSEDDGVTWTKQEQEINLVEGDDLIDANSVRGTLSGRASAISLNNAYADEHTRVAFIVQTVGDCMEADDREGVTTYSSDPTAITPITVGEVTLFDICYSEDAGNTFERQTLSNIDLRVSPVGWASVIVEDSAYDADTFRQALAGVLTDIRTWSEEIIITSETAEGDRYTLELDLPDFAAEELLGLINTADQSLVDINIVAGLEVAGGDPVQVDYDVPVTTQWDGTAEEKISVGGTIKGEVSLEATGGGVDALNVEVSALGEEQFDQGNTQNPDPAETGQGFGITGTFLGLSYRVNTWLRSTGQRQTFLQRPQRHRFNAGAGRRDVKLMYYDSVVNVWRSASETCVTNPIAEVHEDYDTITGTYEVDVCHNTQFALFENQVVAEGAGDPHFEGFHGGWYDFMGEAGKVFNIFSDVSFAVNARFVSFDFAPGATYMGEIGVLAGTHRLSFDAQGVARIPDASVCVPLDAANPRKCALVGGGYVSWNDDSMTVAYGAYRVTVRMEGWQFEGGVADALAYELSIDDSALPADWAPHGVHGQTANTQRVVVGAGKQGEGVVQGVWTDYEVAGGELFGTEWAFNRFAESDGEEEEVVETASEEAFAAATRAARAQ